MLGSDCLDKRLKVFKTVFVADCTSFLLTELPLTVTTHVGSVDLDALSDQFTGQSFIDPAVHGQTMNCNGYGFRSEMRIAVLPDIERKFVGIRLAAVEIKLGLVFTNNLGQGGIN